MSATIATENPAEILSENKIVEFERQAIKVLTETAHYRQLIERFHQLLGGDASLLQGLTIRGESPVEGEAVPLTTKREQWSNFTSVLSPIPPDNIPGRVYTNVRFGYVKGEKFSRIGAVPWVAVAENGDITHVGLPANAHNAQKLQLALEEHVFGFTVDEAFNKRLEFIYSKLFKELNVPFSEAKNKLSQFLDKRQHKPAWNKQGGFGYYSPRLFNAEKFKKKYDITNEELYRAGIMELTISKDGKVTYTKRKDECVLIPFYREQFNLLGLHKYAICNWRMRVINPKKGSAKYLSHPFIRSFKSLPTVDQEMYNAHLLSQAKGKDIFFTEGEFKCHVATQKTGYITVGIPGITMVTDAMLDKLIDSGARSLTIALDADTRAKSAKRADGVTDSERAAYEIAWRYERRVQERKRRGTLKGPYPTVKIGVLSVTAEGDKQGLDDWLLPITDAEAKQNMKHLKDTALTPSQYARHIGMEEFGLNETLAQIKIVKTETRAALRGIHNTIDRLFGTYSEADVEKNPKLEELLLIQEQLEEILTTAESNQVKGLWALYNRGRLNLPGRKYRFLPAKSIPRQDKKAVYSPETKENVIGKAQGDIISAEVYFADMPETEKSPDALGENLPYSMRETFAYFCGRAFDKHIYEDFSRGVKALGLTEDESTVFLDLQRTKNLSQFANILVAGFLSRAFTTDEFTFSTQLPCIFRADRFIEEFTKIELAVFSTKWNQMEMTVIPDVFAPSLAAYPVTGRMEVLPHSYNELSDAVVEEIRKNNPSNPQRASMVAGAKGTRIRSFLRDPTLELQRRKFRQIVSYISEDEIGRERAKEHWAQYGISAATVDKAGLSILTPEDMYRIQRILNKRKLLNQAMLSGLYRMTPEGRISPAFKGDIHILPSQTATSLSIRIGTGSRDKDNKRIEPTQKAFHVLRGARATAPQMDPTSHLFMGSNLLRAKNKTVVLCYNERDAILLNQYLPKNKFVVCGLNSDLTPRTSVISQIKRSGCSDVVVIGKAGPDRRYEGLILEESKPLELFELLDLERRFNNERQGEVAKSVSWVPLQSDLSEWIKQQYQAFAEEFADDEEQAQLAARIKISVLLEDTITYQVRRPSEVALPIYGIKPSEFSAIARLARAREAYEHCIEAVGTASEQDIIKFQKALLLLKKNIHSVHALYTAKNLEFPDDIQPFLRQTYPWTRFKLPSTVEEYKIFKEEHSLGLPLRRIYRGIDTGSASNRRSNANGTNYDTLIDPAWNDSAMADALQKQARAAKQTDYKRRLQEVLSIAIKHGTALPINQDTQKTQYKSKVYSKKRSHTTYSRDRAQQSHNRTVGATSTYVSGLAVAEIFIAVPSADGPQAVSFYGQGASKDAAEQLAAKYACTYLNSLRIDGKKKIKFDWVEKYDKPRRRKLQAQKAKRKEEKEKIRLSSLNQIKYKDGVDRPVGYGFRQKQ